MWHHALDSYGVRGCDGCASVRYNYAQSKMLNQADLIFYGGDIITMDESNPSVEALAVKQDKIVEAGKLGDIWTLKGPSTQVIYLDQKTLLPGFIEPHQHAVLMAEFRSWVNVGAYYYNTFDEIEAKIKDEIAKADSEADPLPWCVFFGWDPELIEDMPTLNADFLDGFSKDIPILVLAQNLHVCWANHKALEVRNEESTIFVSLSDKVVSPSVFGFQ